MKIFLLERFINMPEFINSFNTETDYLRTEVFKKDDPEGGYVITDNYYNSSFVEYPSPKYIIRTIVKTLNFYTNNEEGTTSYWVPQAYVFIFEGNVRVGFLNIENWEPGFPKTTEPVQIEPGYYTSTKFSGTGVFADTTSVQIQLDDHNNYKIYIQVGPEERKCINNHVFCLTNQISDQIIGNGLEVSFRNIAEKLDYAIFYTLTILQPTDLFNYIIENKTDDPVIISEIQSAFRRIFSNFVNDPANITDRYGNYIGDRYGLRILLCSNDGYVIQDVQTFCQNVADRSNSGTNNNYCVQYINIITNPIFPSSVFFNPSNIDLSLYSNFPQQQLNVLKCYSPTRPETLPGTFYYDVVSPDGKKVLPETPPQNNNFSKLQIVDNHSTRTEIQLSRIGAYGYAARRSDTTNLFNWYVARNLGNDFFQNLGTSFVLRLSYFEFPKLT